MSSATRTLTLRRVVVTGVGAVSPLALNARDTWLAICAGKSGIRPVTRFDVSGFPVRFAGTVEGFDASQYIPRKDVKKMGAFIHYGMAASMEAVADAGLEINDANAERIGVVVGSGIGGLEGIEQGYKSFLERGPKRYSPFFIPSCIANMAAGNISIHFSCRGPNLAIVTACSTGTHCIGEAARLIQLGEADAMIAGGCEMATTPSGLGGFAAARALSTRNDDPAAASRPWDKDRDGFVLGDGAGIMVLEEYEQARQRGATIYAEVLGYGMSSDGYHMTTPSPDGDGARRCMANALTSARLNPEDVDYINAHGTSTPVGDVAETQAIKGCFGAHAHALTVSSTKSMIGHLLGAAGGIEAVFCAQALRDQIIPPTINLDNQDPACDLDYVPNQARDAALNVVMSNSFGFGGTNASLILGRL